MRDIIQRFVSRTERFKERAIQPPTPSTGEQTTTGLPPSHYTQYIRLYLSAYVAPARAVKCCDEYACLSVSLSAGLFARITRKPHVRTSRILLCMLPVFMA